MQKKSLRTLLLCSIAAIILNYPAFADNAIQGKVNEQDLITGNANENIEANVPENTEQNESKVKAWLQGDYATGDWGGLRTKLEEKGITIEVNQTNDNFLKVRGGIEGKARVKSINLLDMAATLDTEKMGLWKGGTFFVLGQTVYGQSITNSSVGDFQTLSSIDAPTETMLGEFWYQQSLIDDKFRIKLGKQDADGDFAATTTSFEFINSSFSLNPGIPLPTYPNQSLGASTIIEPAKWLSLKAGVFDSDVDDAVFGYDNDGGVVVLEEICFKPTIKGLPGEYLFGLWQNTSEHEEIAFPSNRVFTRSYGFYTAIEQMVYKEKVDAEDDQGLRLLGQFGWSPQDRNEVARFYSAAMAYKGLLPKRDRDFTGLGFVMAQFSGRYKSDPAGSRTREAAIELFHKFQLNNWLALQPDFQLILNPNGNNRDAVVFGLRSIINF